MEDPEQVNKLRKSKKFHNELRKSNYEKEAQEDMILKFGEKIADKNSELKIPTNE